MNKFVTKILKYNIAIWQGGKKKALNFFIFRNKLLWLIPYILLTFSLQQIIVAQTETYTITKAPFSSDKYDEYSPVFYQNGIVFCTNRDGSLSNYSSSENKRLFNINFVDTTERINWKSSKLFSKNLRTNLNDGPVSFSRTEDTVYFSRNLEVDKKSDILLSARNKLGIFFAIKEGDTWTKVRELRSNSEWYNITTPWLSPDGKRLYFASDMPDGHGGSDLYYCQWKGDYWDDPVNMGPVINTKGNEAYPFINPAGELFFASDGHQGLGGKDIFFSRFSGNTWLTPVRLDAPVNSQYDDFGIVTDSLISEGYFSSNRDNTLDIYHFTTNFPQIFYSTIQKDNKYCFRISDSGNIVVDTLMLNYFWDFGDGETALGSVVSHCFPGAGEYNVKLDIIDKNTGNLFFSKLSFNLDLKEFEQPYITSPDFAVPGKKINLNGLKSNFHGYEILDYAWDFGDGTRSKGESVEHVFLENGEFMVNLGLTLKSVSSGNIHNTGVTKKVIVTNSQKVRELYLEESTFLRSDTPSIFRYENANIESLYSAEDELAQGAEFQVELISSKTRIALNSSMFSDVSERHSVNEFYNTETKTYSYIIDKQLSLMATYIAWQEIVEAGFSDARTIIKVIKDPAAKELNNIKRIFGTGTDLYFDRYSRLTSSAYLMLDQVVKILNKYPGIKIEIDVHTDNNGSAYSKLVLSRRYAQLFADYMEEKGINSDRLIVEGLGVSRPIAPNNTEKDRAVNRRVDFSIIYK